MKNYIISLECSSISTPPSIQSSIMLCQKNIEKRSMLLSVGIASGTYCKKFSVAKATLQSLTYVCPSQKTYLASDIWFIRYRISQISDLSSQSVTKTPLAIHHYLHLHAYCISAPHTQPLRITNCHLSAITPISSLPHSQSLRTISIGHYAHQPS